MCVFPFAKWYESEPHIGNAVDMDMETNNYITDNPVVDAHYRRDVLHRLLVRIIRPEAGR